MSDKELLELAARAREASYCPYSGISVGAALLCRDGRIFTGANIENASFSPTVCAERVALFSAVHEGEREFEAIAIVGGRVGNPPTKPFAPCGVCRQALSEFADGGLRVITTDGESISVMTLDELLPFGFGSDSF